MTINGLTCKILAKKGKKAEIEIEGQKIIVLAEYLPAAIGVGEEIRLQFLPGTESQIQEKKLAKLILEEILNGK